MQHVFQVRVIQKKGSVRAAKRLGDVNLSSVNGNNGKMCFRGTLLIQAELVVELQTKTLLLSYGQ